MTKKLDDSQLSGSTASPLLFETIGRAFDKTVEQYREASALVVSHQNIRWTYAEYQRQVDRLACGLLASELSRWRVTVCKIPRTQNNDPHGPKCQREDVQF
tara:strand:- start:7681 stop:7983 length:303 start_codon:yes stop_codon:yes gene_type:complete